MTFDLLIKNGSLIDGTGKTAAYLGDLGVQGDRITAIGDLSSADAHDILDARNCVVAPGFIDVHVHSEIALLTGIHRYAELQQGVTTQLLTPDGFGWTGLTPEQTTQLWTYTRFSVGNLNIPLGWRDPEDYLAIFEGNIPANVFPQVPHCALRLAVCGWEARPATDNEIEQMANLTRQWMEAGAGGLNLGLDYQPSANADFRELVALCKVAAQFGGNYAAHVRYHTIGRQAAWEETMALSRAAGIPVHISHERVDLEILPILERIDREGVDLTFESYLYAAGMTHMYMMLPMKFQIGSPEEVNARLESPQVREESLVELKKWLGRADQVVGYTGSNRFIGRRLSDLARENHTTPEAFAYDLLLEEHEHQAFVFPWQDEPEAAQETLLRTARHPRMMVASDGIFNIPHPHPRGFGCFARVLGHFVRERKALTLEEAVYKMSGFPAKRFGIPNRGELAVGKAADIVVFDPDTVGAQSTYDAPTLPPSGIRDVIVNGKRVIREGQPTHLFPGRVIRHGEK
ncbi:MAG: D-aminoacylase [bacterium]|nr:D-aminoacylase [bacterium]